MLLNDKPINKQSEDRLGRSAFSSKLADIIYQYDKSDCFVMGLYGKWGAGKTSVINMLTEELCRLIAENNDENTIILHFNPWLFTDQIQLITQFFKQLANKLKSDIYKKRASKIASNLESYAQVMEITSFVPGLNTVGKISSFISNKIRKRIADNNDLQSIKDRIIKEVVSSELKIVAIIDDIDRLNDEEIRAVFQLVKSLADFPNMMYFLSFDLDTVTHALNSVQDGNGLKFLEKIVQMPFELPEIKGNKVHEYLFSKLDSVLEEDYILEFDRHHWSNIFLKGVQFFINTIRDANRFINAFDLRYKMLKEYVNASDLIALTVLQVFEPNIYKELYGVGLQFCGSIPLYIGMQQDANKKKVAESYAEILEKFAIKKEATGNLLEILFPKISQCLDRYYYAYNHEKMMIEKRICIEKCFYSYFTFNLIDEIPVSLIHRILFEASEDEFDSLVETFSSEGKIEDIVITADALLHQFKETDKYKEKMPLIFKRISNNWKFFSKEEEPKGLFSLPVDWRTCKLLESALYIIKSKEERCRSILELFSGEELSLELCVFLYRVLEKPFTKEDFHDDETSLIDKATIEKLKNVLKDRIRVRMENQSIRTLNNYDNIIYFLEDIDGMLLKEFLACCAGDELSLAGVISTFVNRGEAESDHHFSIWRVDKDRIEKYFYIDLVYTDLMNLLDNGKINELNRNRMLKVLSFIIYYETRGARESEEILIEEITERFADN